MTDPMNALWRAQQDAAANFTESWRTMLQPPGDRTAAVPAPSDTDDVHDADEPEQIVDAGPDDVRPDADDGTSDEVADPDPEPEPEPGPSVADAFRAIRAVHDGQRDLAQHLTCWADLQRDLADAMTAFARRQRDHADALDRVLATFPPAPGERPAES